MSQEINLYQPLFRREKVLFSALTMFWLMIGFSVLLLAYAWFTGQSVRDLATEVDSRQAAEQRLAGRLAELRTQLDARTSSAALQRDIERAESRLEQLRDSRTLLRRRVPDRPLRLVSPLIALGESHPDGLWLTGIELAANGADMTLTGQALVADRLPLFLEQLRDAPALDGMSFRTLSIESSDDSVIHFRISTQSEQAEKTDR